MVAAGCMVGIACSCAMKMTRFTNPQFDFGFVEKVAVLPLENLSKDAQAGERATRILITELLASGAVDVVEPGELRAAVQELKMDRTTPTSEQIIALGEHLQLQAVITGSITQSDVIRSGSVLVPVVTLDLHMLETETGQPVWAATHTEKGSGVGAALLGTGAEPISRTTRRCVREAIGTLVQ
jgi:hypothetical protein